MNYEKLEFKEIKRIRTEINQRLTKEHIYLKAVRDNVLRHDEVVYNHFTRKLITMKVNYYVEDEFVSVMNALGLGVEDVKS